MNKKTLKGLLNDNSCLFCQHLVFNEDLTSMYCTKYKSFTSENYTCKNYVVNDIVNSNPLISNDNTIKTLNKGYNTKELRFYLVDIDRVSRHIIVQDLTDEEFMEEAEKQGNVYTLDGFVKGFNEVVIHQSTDILRVIEIELP